MEDWKKYILDNLPYGPGFHFVDAIESISEDGVTGQYTFNKGLAFYKHHFPNNPITPGVILTECMAQIGLVSLGMYLLRNEGAHQFLMTSTEINFIKAVMPGQTVKVTSEKIYFRLGKLKARVKMEVEGERVSYGTISGMIVKSIEVE